MSDSEDSPEFGPENAVTSGVEEQSHDRPTDADLEEQFEQATQEPEPEEPSDTDDSGVEVNTPSQSDDVYSPVNHEYDIPYVMFRQRAMDWRGGTKCHFRVDVFEETVDELEEIVEELTGEYHMTKTDAREILLRVGMQNMDEVKEEAEQWGFER